jgi:hypothetical protein
MAPFRRTRRSARSAPAAQAGRSRRCKNLVIRSRAVMTRSRRRPGRPRRARSLAGPRVGGRRSGRARRPGSPAVRRRHERIYLAKARALPMRGDAHLRPGCRTVRRRPAPCAALSVHRLEWRRAVELAWAAARPRPRIHAHLPHARSSTRSHAHSSSRSPTRSPSHAFTHALTHAVTHALTRAFAHADAVNRAHRCHPPAPSLSSLTGPRGTLGRRPVTPRAAPPKRRLFTDLNLTVLTYAGARGQLAGRSGAPAPRAGRRPAATPRSAPAGKKRGQAGPGRAGPGWSATAPRSGWERSLGRVGWEGGGM